MSNFSCCLFSALHELINLSAKFKSPYFRIQILKEMCVIIERFVYITVNVCVLVLQTKLILNKVILTINVTYEIAKYSSSLAKTFKVRRRDQYCNIASAVTYIQ